MNFKSFKLKHNPKYLRRYEVFKAIFVKYIKEKFRSFTITIVILLWPFLLFFLLLKGSHVFEKPSEEYAYFNARPLPSNGIGPFFYGLVCIKHNRLKKEDLHSKDYHASRFKRVVDFFEQNLKDVKSSTNFKIFLKSITNTIIFLGTQYRKNPKYNLKASIFIDALNINTWKWLKKKYAEKTINDTSDNLKYWLYKSMHSLFHIIDNRVNDEFLELIEDMMTNSKFEMFKIKDFLCDNLIIPSSLENVNWYIKTLKNFPIENLEFAEEKLTIQDLYKDPELNSSEINRDFENNVNMIYGYKKGNVLLVGPDENFTHQIIKRYNEYFSSVHQLIEILNDNRDRISLLQYYFNFILEKNISKPENITQSKLANQEIPAHESSPPDTNMENEKMVLGFLPIQAIAANISDIELQINDPLSGMNKPLIGLHFTEYIKNYSYILTFHSYLSNTNSDAWKQPLDREEYPSFYFSAISLVQDIVDSIIIKENFPDRHKFDAYRQFSMTPSKCFVKTRLFIFYAYSVPILFTVVQLPALAYMLFYLSNEKNKKIIKYLELIEIDSTIYFLQTRVIDFFLTIIPYIPVLFIFKDSELIRHSSFTLIFFYLILVLFSSNCLFMLCARFFKHESIGMAMGFTILIFGSVISIRIKLDIFIPYTFMHHFIHVLSYVPYCQFWDSLLYIEFFMKRGLSHADMFTNHLPWEPYPMSLYLVIILVDGFLYLLLEHLFRKVFSGKLSFYRYIRSKKQRKRISKSEDLIIDGESNFDKNQNVGISFKNVSVAYTSKDFIFKKMSINLEFNKIYVILGENGAGKSTFINTLLGIIKPVSGDINIVSKFHKNMPNIGFCPQYNVLMDNLSVKEHFIFYFALKTGRGYKDCIKSIDEIIEKMDLVRDANTYAKNLSGGQKRKVSIGICMINNPEILIFDEPTSSVDPGSREQIYDILNKIKKDKIIIITTHHIEEAEILAEEILFLFFGKFYHHGSILNMNEIFGSKTKLTIEFTQKMFEHKTFIDNLLNICPHIIDLKYNESGILLYLCRGFKITRHIEDLLIYLKSNRRNMKIKSWYINDSSLEEIFIELFKSKLETIDSKIMEFSNDEIKYINSTSITDYKSIIEKISIRGKKPSVFYHIYLLMIHKFMSNLTDVYFYFLQFFVPIFITIITCYLANSLVKHTNHLEIASLESFSKIYKLYIPLFYENLNEMSSNKKMLDIILDEYENGKNNYIELEKSNNQINDTCCVFQNTSICYVNRLPKKEIDLCEKKFPLIKHKRNNCYLHLIKKCNSDQYLSYTRFNHIYENLFSIQLRDKMLYSETKLILARESGLGMPLGINYINNLILKINAKKYKTELKEINVKFNIKHYGIVHSLRNQIILNTYAVILYVITFISICSIFSWEIIKERVSGYKSTQYNLGINNFSYWLSTYIVNWIYYLVVAFICIFIMYLMNANGLSDRFAIEVLSISCLLFGFSFIPYQYLFSFVINSGQFSYMASIITSFIFLFLKNVTRDFYLKFQRKKLPDKKYGPMKKILNLLLKCFPVTYKYRILNRLMSTRLKYPIDADVTIKSFYEDFLGLFYLGVAVHSVCLIRIFILEKIKFSFADIIFKFVCKNKNKYDFSSDESVLNEKDFVFNHADSSNSQIIIKNIDKKYFSFAKKRNIYAVKNVNLSLRNNECLCLLGKNGAGKSTIFRMLVGDEAQSNGNIEMSRKDKNSVFFTYCPQTDNLNENMTPNQILYHLCKIYGYSKDSIDIIVKELINSVSIRKYTHVKINKMSAGNKRRLCAAISIIGNPSVILLDEPTAGVDPSARYLIWNLLYNFKKSGKSILFTSHNMRECEIYGERIALIEQGKIKCVGSHEFLKKSFNLGYEILITSDENSLKAIQNNICKQFPNSKFENIKKAMKVMIPISFEELENLFVVLNDTREEGYLFSYILNQARMENIFFRK